MNNAAAQASLDADTPRRLDRLGVHSLDHFCLSVPDLAVAKDFYTAFGLDVRHKDGALLLHTYGHSHCWAVVRSARRKQLEYLSFGAFEDDIDRIQHALLEADVELLRSGEHVTDQGLWFKDCDGRLVQVKAAKKSSPNDKPESILRSTAPGTRGTTTRDEQKSVLPSRLAHILLFTTDVKHSVDFYSRILGLRLSDEAGVVAFMHGAHGSDHHLLAFAKGDGSGLHHSSWNVGSVQEVGLGAMQMAAAGYPSGWGVGRHVLGSNYFYYVRDPWNSYAEYSYDIDYVPAEIDWSPGSFTPENGFYLWAPLPPEDFAKDYEAEPALASNI